MARTKCCVRRVQSEAFRKAFNKAYRIERASARLAQIKRHQAEKQRQLNMQQTLNTQTNNVRATTTTTTINAAAVAARVQHVPQIFNTYLNVKGLYYTNPNNTNFAATRGKPLPKSCGICNRKVSKKLPFYPVGHDLNYDNRKNVCSHFYCLDCLKQWISAQIEEGAHRPNCPHTDCLYKMYVDDVLRLDEDLGKALYKNTQMDYKKRANNLRKEGGVELEKYVNQNTRKCPNCSLLIERSFGCNSMSCRCGTRFCYTCGESLERYTCECTRAAQALQDRRMQEQQRLQKIFQREEDRKEADKAALAARAKAKAKADKLANSSAGKQKVTTRAKAKSKAKARVKVNVIVPPKGYRSRSNDASAASAAAPQSRKIKIRTGRR